MSNNDYSDLMTIHTVDAGSSAVMYLVGECDISTVPALTKELCKAIDEGKHVVLDVHLLMYIDSTGISAIISARESLTQSGRELRIVGAHGIFQKIAHMTRIDEIIPLHDNVDDALSAIDRI